MNKPLYKYIEHTLLKPEATQHEIEALCLEALEAKLWGVCVAPSFVTLAASMIQSRAVVVSVVGFPLGSTTCTNKAAEAAECVRAGASEVDMVLHVGALKDKRYDYVNDDIQAVVRASGVPVKVIIETGLLSDEEKAIASRLVVQGGAHFVKTCTGFAKGEATVSDIALIRRTVGADFGIKASGGIRTHLQACALIDAGATRIGTSRGVAILSA